MKQPNNLKSQNKPPKDNKDKKRGRRDDSPASPLISGLKKRRSVVKLNEGPDRTLRSRTGTQSQVGNTSNSQLPHDAVLSEAVATPDGMQSSTILKNAHHFSIKGKPNFQNQNIGSVTNVYDGGKNGLEALKRSVSFDAEFDSSTQDPQRRCHPKTRENVLKRLREWFDNPDSAERIFWLYGPAGAGKSAIAQTIAHSYCRPKLAASFFFFRSDVNRNDGSRLFPTLAYQLALSIPAVKDYIVNSLSERPELPRAAVETQFKELLARPFQALNTDATDHEQLASVVIIDGIDECSSEPLQRRFLKVIGDAVKDDHFLLRFLIVSRPEVHIEQTIRRFKTPILTIDLAKLDDANRDIEKYLVDEFSRIASEQGLEPTWPGPEIIDRIVYKSSGNFIFPSLVIRFVGDPYMFAKNQLEIVLNMKPPKTMSPFVILDQLFMEILRRVTDQEFLKKYLVLLTARISVPSSYGHLYKDDTVLMHVSEEELHVNLRRMRSLLKFEPFINVYHKSFLDFLHDSSRSGEYYVGQPGGIRIRRYLVVVVDSLVRYISTMIKQPAAYHRNAVHFTPKFRTVIKTFPLKIELPVNEWPEVMEPLLDLQDDLLQKSDFDATDLQHCDKCIVFFLLRDLLHIEMFNRQSDDTPIRSVINVRKRKGVVSSTTTKREEMNRKEPESVLMSLFAHLPEIMENWSPDKHVIKLMKATLDFDSSEVARKVRFVSDAHKLVDLLVYLIDEKNKLSSIQPDAPRKATLLALEIFARVPWKHGIPIQVLSQTIFASRVLDRRYIFPIYVVEKGKYGVGLVSGDAGGNDLPMGEWRLRSTPSTVKAIQVILGLAKAIQYFHSMDIVLHAHFGSNDVFLDSALRPKIRCLCSFFRIPLEQSLKAWFSLADNIFSFGCLLYEVFSTVDTKPTFSTKQRRRLIAYRPFKIPEYVWQLIQQCCAQDPKSRPTIDEIVKEMETWKTK